jgi:hypothetical protein
MRPQAWHPSFSFRDFVLFQIFHKLADFVQLPWYADVLRTVWLALSAAYAVVGLTQPRHGTVEAYQVVAAQFEIFLIHFQTG